jgi:hypothetical protein
MPDQQPYSPPRTAYAILAGSLANRPDVIRTAPSTLRMVLPMVGDPQTYMIETVRDEHGDTVFIEYVDGQGVIRLALPPAVTSRIAAQREALTTRGRRIRSKAAMRQRMADGYRPTPPRPKRKPKKKPGTSGG